MKKIFAITFLVLSMSLFASALTVKAEPTDTGGVWGANTQSGGNNTQTTQPTQSGVNLIVPLGGSGGTTQSTSAGQYISKLYTYGIGLGALLALLMIVWGAVQYTASAGFPSVRNDAKDKMLGAIFGLILLLGAVVILNTVGVLKNGTLTSALSNRLGSGTNNAQSLANKNAFGSDPAYQNFKGSLTDKINRDVADNNFEAVNGDLVTAFDGALSDYRYDSIAGPSEIVALQDVLMDAKSNFSAEDFKTATDGLLNHIQQKVDENSYGINNPLSEEKIQNINLRLVNILK